MKAFKDELRQLGLGDIVDNFDHFTSPETLLAQREYFQVLKRNKLNFSAYDSLSSVIYISPKNLKFRKEALELLSEEAMLSKFSMDNIISNTNKTEQVEIIKSCLKNQDVPQNLICEFVEKAETMPIKEVLNEIKNNPIVMTNKAIREAEFSLITKGLNPQKSNPLNIDENALALVHMTDYEPEFGEIRAGEKRGFFSGYDVDRLEDILLHSGTPNETFERLARAMNIGPTYSFEDFVKRPHCSETRLMDALLTQVKFNPEAQKFFNSPYIDINHIRKELAFDF